MPRVTAILVVRNGEQWLDRTLAALAAQTRRPDGVVMVDAGSTDDSSEKLAGAVVTQFVTAGASSFGAAVSVGLRATPPDEEDEWLWLLSADTAPEQDALRQLLAAVEIAPSVAIAGPKLVDPTDRGHLLSFGESMSGLGATVRLVDGEYDQAQHDAESDVLAAAAAGMLIRRAVWTRLAGFDPGLPTVDAGLDLSIRARLAGFRVIRVPGARVTRGQRPEDFGRRKPASERTRRRLGRIAQLHRRFVYAPGLAMPFHWLALLPLAVVRSIGHLFAKRPGAIGGEFTAAFVAAFDGGVPPARRRLRITRTVGWATLAPLRVPAAELRERRAAARERTEPGREPEPPLVRASFLSGGIGAVVLAAVIGLVMWGAHLGATALQGGALLPLSSDPATLWSQLGWGWREIGVGFDGAADPFTVVLALLGSATWWSTSLSIVLVWATALPLAALGAWWCATRLSRRAWPPIAAAILWALAPPLLVGLVDGRPGAVLAHLLLPWLVLAAIEGARSWSAAAAAALLFAAVTACAPVLFPALLVAALFWAFARPRSLFQLLGIPLPAIVLLGPVVLTQLARGTPLGSIIDPGAVAPFVLPSGWDLLLGDPDGTAGGWGGLLAAMGITAIGPIAALVPALLLAPLAALALLAIFLPGARQSIPAVLLALAGLGTAVASVHLQPAAAGAVAVGPWPGSGLSLYWLGLVGAAVVALQSLGRAALGAGIVVVIAAAVAVAPLVVAPHLEPGAPGAAAVSAGNGRLLPAIVLAEGSVDPGTGTLRLLPQDDGSLAARIERGEGTMLDEQSTLYAGRETLTEDEKTLAELAGNLASHSGYNPAPALEQFRLRFVLLPTLPADADVDAREVRQRAEEALDAVVELTPVGESSYGSLWRFDQLEAARPPCMIEGQWESPCSSFRRWSSGSPCCWRSPPGVAVVSSPHPKRRRTRQQPSMETPMTDEQPTPAEDVATGESPDANTDAGEESPRGSRRAAVVALRVTRGTVGVAAAIAVVLLVGLVPLPTVAITPPSVEVVPEPEDEMRICAGAILRLGDATGQDAGTGVALGVPSVRSGSVGGTLRPGVLEATDAGTGGTSAAPAVFTLTPEPGATIAAAQSQVVDDEGFSGYAATACAEPSGSVWLVGGATTVGRTTLLTLANPTQVDATVSLSIFGENGAVTAPGLSGIHVAAGSQRVLSLAGFAPDLLSPVIHVESRGGRVAAWLQQSITRILDPGGIELIGESAAPDVHQVVPGVRILDAVGVSRTLGREDYADLVPVVRLAVPGELGATVTVSVVPEDPALPGTSFEVELDAGRVVDVPLDAGVEAEGGGVALADGLYTVTVDADQPVVAGVRVSTAEEPTTPVDQVSPFVPPVPPVTDFAWFAAAPAMRGDTLFTVAPGAEPRVTVVNSSSSALEVLLEAQGGADVSVVVPAHGSASAGVEPGISYLVAGSKELRAAISYAAVGRLAGYPIVSGRPGSTPIVVLP